MRNLILVNKKDFVEIYKSRKFSMKGLENIKFPIYANKNLAKILSYITFDGHLALSERMFYFSSSKIKELDDFKNIVNAEFGITGKIIKTPNSFGTSYRYLLMNSHVSRLLRLIGTPKGAKIKMRFGVPEWIARDIPAVPRDAAAIGLAIGICLLTTLWAVHHVRKRLR